MELSVLASCNVQKCVPFFLLTSLGTQLYAAALFYMEGYEVATELTVSHTIWSGVIDNRALTDAVFECVPAPVHIFVLLGLAQLCVRVPGGAVSASLRVYQCHQLVQGDTGSSSPAAASSWWTRDKRYDTRTIT